MRLEDDIGFTTLNWVKAELDEALTQARQLLETYVAEPDDGRLMRDCAERLHQVQGTLRMVELYGAAMVVQEMEHLVGALIERRVEQRDDAYTALMRGLVQMPDYLERLQSGHRDIPIVLLPLLNDLRSARGEGALHESALFTPNLETPLPEDVPGAAPPLARETQKQRVGNLRVRFQQPLLAWFRGRGGRDSLAAMRDTLDAIAGCCHTLAARRLWWITAGVLDGLQLGSLDAYSNEVKQLIGRVDRFIKALVEHGEAALVDDDVENLVRTLLYYVAMAEPGSERLQALGRTYLLDRLLARDEEVEHARSAMAGHNRALLDTVSHAIKEDLLRVKDGLDLFLRKHDGDPAELTPQIEVMERVADTLGMLGLNVPRRVVGEQRRIVQDIASKVQAPDENTLLDVAGALLYVEASLDDHIARLGADGAHPVEAEPEETHALPRTEARQVLEALMREAVDNLGRVKEAVVAFIESPWDHVHLAPTPQLLEEIAGALRMLDEARPTELMEGIARFIENELVFDRRVPTVEQMDKLADALASMEYYLEAAREHRGGLAHILDVTEQSLAALGYWPVPPRREAPAEEPDNVAADAAASAAGSEVEPELSEPVSMAPGHGLEDLVVGEAGHQPPVGEDIAGLRLAETADRHQAGDDEDWVEIEEDIEEEQPVPDAMAAAAGFQTTADELDAEIREVFLEEVQEEIDGLNSKLTAWLKQRDDLGQLTAIRRAFHTLKGSGRLVGAQVLGEFAWKVENMLNRVLDGSVQPHDGVEALVRHAVDALPDLLAALKGEGVPRAPLEAIVETADRLAAGEDGARVEQFAKPRTELVRRTVRRRVPRAEAGGVAAGADDVPAASLAGVSAEEPDTDAEHAPAPAPAEPVVDLGSALPPMDPVLLEILRSELTQHLQTVRQTLDTPTEIAIEEPLLRAVHTMNGAIAMVEIPQLSQVLAPLESYLKRLRAMGVPLPAEGESALAESADVIEQFAAQFDAAQPELPDTAGLGERLTALRDALPEPNLAHVLYGGLNEEVPDEAGGDQPIAEAAGEPGADQPGSDDDRVPTLDGDDLSAAFADAMREGDEDDTEPMRMLDLSDLGEGYPPELAEHFGEASAASTTEPDHEPEPAQASEPTYESEAVEPEAVEPEAVEPEAVEPEAVEPEAVEPEAVEPEAVEPEAVEPEAVEPEAVEPEAVEPEAVEPEAVEPEAVEPEAVEPEAVEPEAVEPEAVEPEAVEPEAVDEPEVADTAAEPAQAGDAALGTLPADFSFPEDPQPDGALDVPDLDPDLLEIFIEEARDLLDHADGVMAQLREAPGKREHVADLQRDLHTFKGGARIAALPQLGDLAHAMESLLEAIGGGRREVDAVVVESLERGFDRLHDLVQRVAGQQAVAMPARAIAHFEALAEGVTAPPHAAETAAPAQSPEPVSEAGVDSAETGASSRADTAVTADQGEEPRRSTALPALLPESEEGPVAAPQELIRVRSDLLDSLVNYAGEVSIYRSRLEQQVSSFRFNLVEFDQTVARLRDQLRKLEIETEAQIIARYQREQRETGGDAAFDPLELDRFSQMQQYSRALAESVSDLVSLQNMLDDITRQSETLLLQQSRVSSELQEGLMRTRMVPFDSMVPTLRRTLRQAASEVGKRAQLRVVGAHGEMDRNLLERMKAPFEHMLRNALAHGIEPLDQRRSAGKPDEGTVTIEVTRDATEVVIRVSDDGGGMDRDAIRRKAIERGLLREGAGLSDRDLFGFILESGFSTAQAVTQLAGRGVGMDVVANEIKQMGGTLAIDSERGKGTTFIIRLPFTLAVTQAILVKIGESVFAVPMTSVQGVARIDRDDLAARLAAGEPSINYANEDYNIYDLAQLIGVPAAHGGDERQLPLLLSRSGTLRAAVRVDQIMGSREIVVKSVGPQVSSVPGIFGATIMGDGSVLMILDLAPLVRHGAATLQHAEAEVIEEEGPVELAAVLPPALATESGRPLVMVVDDSITMRKVSSRVLERNDFEVSTAKDGMDAVEKLQERVPDLMLLDIEMPRMDGYELATYMKNDARLRQVPIIMITSRTGEKHRQRALDIGVDRYLGKPYQEADLIGHIRQILGESE